MTPIEQRAISVFPPPAGSELLDGTLIVKVALTFEEENHGALVGQPRRIGWQGNRARSCARF